MKYQKFSGYLFYLFLFLLPIQTVYFFFFFYIGGVQWEYGVIGVYAIDILLVVILGLALLRWLRSIKYQVLGIKYGRLELILLALLLWVGLSIFWAPDQMLALYFFVKLLLGGGLFLMVRGMEIDVKKVVFVLLAAGVIQSGIGVAQFLYQESPASSILGISSHQAWQVGSSVLKIDSGRFLRAYGTFPHPNVLGGFLGAILVMSIMYYVSGIKYKRSWKCVTEIAAMLSGVLILFLGLILTFSRTAWLGVILGITVYYVVSIRYQVWEIRIRFYKILTALALASLVFGYILSEQIFPRFDTVTIEREGSVSERIASLQDAQMLIGEYPLVGVGAGNFTAAIMDKNPDRPVWDIQPAHNVFLLIWSELGLVGLLLFVGFLVSSLFLILKSKIINHTSAILIVLIPSLLLDHWLWTSHFGLLFMFLLLGFASRK